MWHTAGWISDKWISLLKRSSVYTIIVSYVGKVVAFTHGVCLRRCSRSDDHTPGGAESSVAGSSSVVVVAAGELQSEKSFPVAEVESSPAQRQSAFSDDSPGKKGLLQMPGQGSVLGHPVAGRRILCKYRYHPRQHLI